MEDIFIQALAERSKKEAGLIDQLPQDIKIRVEERLTTELQTPDIEENEIPS